MPVENVIEGYFSADFIVDNVGLKDKIKTINPTCIIGALHLILMMEVGEVTQQVHYIISMYK